MDVLGIARKPRKGTIFAITPAMHAVFRAWSSATEFFMIALVGHT